MIDKIKENWEKILLILKEEHEVSDVSYRTWLQPLTPYSCLLYTSPSPRDS